ASINNRYQDAFADIPGIPFMPAPPPSRPNFWLTVVLLDPERFGASPEEVRKLLEHLDIEARPAWKPMHLQPVFAAFQVRGGHVAEEIFRTGLCLPSGSTMSDDDVDRVAGAVRTARRCVVTTRLLLSRRSPAIGAKHDHRAASPIRDA